MKKKIFIHGGSSLITKELISKFYNEYDEIYIFSRNIKVTKTNLEKYVDKIFLYENHLEDFEKTLKDLQKLPNNINAILWISGNTGNALEELESLNDCKKTLDINFNNVVLSINFLIKNKFKIQEDSFICALTSVAGMRGRGFNLFYGSAKSALISYLSGLRQIYNKKINIITVIPGYMRTSSFVSKSPKFLISSPQKSANIIYSAIKNKKNIVYIDYKWRLIMFIIFIIPEFIFKKLKF